MRVPANLMMAIGKAALRFVGADLVVDVVEIAKTAWDDWKESPEERLEELEALVGADEEAVGARPSRSSRKWPRVSRSRFARN